MKKASLIIVLLLSLMVIGSSEAASLPAAFIMPLSMTAVDIAGTPNPYCTKGEDCSVTLCYEAKGRGITTVPVTVNVYPQGSSTSIYPAAWDVTVDLTAGAAPGLTCETQTLPAAVTSLVTPGLYTVKVTINDSGAVNKVIQTKVRVINP